MKSLNGSRAITCALSLVVLLTCCSAGAEVVQWNYERDPVKVTENHAPSGYWAVMSVASNAFDGYGARGGKPGCGRAWQGQLPSKGSPQVCEIDYGRSVAVTAFANYFYVPGCPDLRSQALGPSAFKRVKVSTRDSATAAWSEVADLKDLPAGCPQVLAVPHTQPARYWKLEVLELAPGAKAMCSYEIETYTGGIPTVRSAGSAVDLPAAFGNRMATHKPSGSQVDGSLALNSDASGLQLKLQTSGSEAIGTVQFKLGAQPCSLHSVGSSSWAASSDGGALVVESQKTPMGMLLQLKYEAKADNPVKYAMTAISLKAADVKLYYEPGFTWSRTPVEEMIGTYQKPTRMLGLGTQDAMLCLVPGTDRGQTGFQGGAAVNSFVVGPEPTPLLLTMVKGDSWDAYRFVVKEVYDFKVRPMVYPSSEMQYASSKHLMSEEVWEPALGALRIPNRSDREKKQISLAGRYDAYNFYGAYSSIPAYCSRWVMSHDAAALERCRSIVHWLCSSGVRVKDGPSRGAFFTMQRFVIGESPSMAKQGVCQANRPILTNQATGATLWSLLYYKRVTGDDNPEANKAIQEAADWLLKTQNSNGGWPYGHNLKGQAIDGFTPEGKPWKDMPSSGSIWSIWALWRMGKETGDRKYLDAAERGTAWFVKEFVEKHRYHGYWEDVGPGSVEGYEAGIATLAFAEMGKKDLALTTARDAAQWVVTRQVEYREGGGSLGHFPEQKGWTLGSYLSASMSLAMYTAWRETGDDFWRPYFMTTQASVCDLYCPELGAFFWSDQDGLAQAPTVGQRDLSDVCTWADYFDAQSGVMMLRLLVKEATRRSGGAIRLDEETLRGTVLGQSARAWTPSGGFRPILPPDGQMEWLGFKSGSSVMVALMNHGEPGNALCPLNRVDVNGADLRPKAVHYCAGGKIKTQEWDGKTPVRVGPDGLTILEWSIAQ